MTEKSPLVLKVIVNHLILKNICNIENNTWQNPYHMLYHPEKPISSRGHLGPRDDVGQGWYGIWYGFCHVLYTIIYLNRRVYRVFIISYIISTMPLIIHVFYENFEFFEILNIFFNFENLWKFWIFLGYFVNFGKILKYEILKKKLENLEILWNFEICCHVLYTLSYI